MKVMVRAMRAFEKQQQQRESEATIVARPRIESADYSGLKMFFDPKRWFYNQLCGWRPDKDGNYHGIWNRLQNAEFKKLFIGDDLDIVEVESAISTIAFVSLSY